jgi:hypothetical protein
MATKFALDNVDWRVVGFMSDQWRKRLVQQDQDEKERYFKNLVETRIPEAWNEDTTKFADLLFIDGKTFTPYQFFVTDPVPAGRTPKDHQGVWSKDGHFFLFNRSWPSGVPLRLMQNRRRGYVWFTTEVCFPVLVDASDTPRQIPRCNADDVWMSLTPMEVLTQRKAVQLAKGKVLVGGIGLGWLLRKVCEKKSVTEVIVVEKNQSLLDWIGGILVDRNLDVIHKVTEWICDDVYNQVGKHGDETLHLLDIWKSYGGCDHKFDQLKKTLPPGKLWGWGDFV